MIVNKLEKLFSDLNHEEIERLNNSDVDVTCDIDMQIVSRACDRVKTKVSKLH